MNSIKYAIHPDDFKHYDSARIRQEFLLEHLFQEDLIINIYTHYDRYIVGGAYPISKDLRLESFTSLKANYYLERRELGIINVGNAAKVTVDGQDYELKYKEALYIGKNVVEVIFHPASEGKALFYFNSAPAHMPFPTKKISLTDAETVELGTLGTSNHRIIRKLIVNSVVSTCQLQMGLTELKNGSVWNTMPPHTHDRRMEAYFYFEIPEDHSVCHFLGQPQETRHIWLQNNQAVLSPPWSIHSGAGTTNYCFIWGMAGENLDYSDMDSVRATDLR